MITDHATTTLTTTLAAGDSRTGEDVSYPMVTTAEPQVLFPSLLFFGTLTDWPGGRWSERRGACNLTHLLNDMIPLRTAVRSATAIRLNNDHDMIQRLLTIYHETSHAMRRRMFPVMKAQEVGGTPLHEWVACRAFLTTAGSCFLVQWLQSGRPCGGPIPLVVSSPRCHTPR